MSEFGDQQNKDGDLEALLKKLEPNPLHFDFIAELNRDCERLASHREERHATRMPRRYLVPLSIVGTALMAGFGYFQFGERLGQTKHFRAENPTVVAAPPTESARPQFVPVSAHGYLLNTSSGGVIQTEEGPRQRLHIEYEDAYHWHDPTSGTNLRFFQPRREEVIVPLRTD
jgi:hypothetical protein